MIELLSPVGDFECLKAAVQNGADAVYFGASTFSARAFASNFDDDALEKAITYAKLRGVKTNLTLNTLIKNNEMQDAIDLAAKAYNYGIDAIIVQDLGLARYLIKNFPGLAVHGSTQMSVHNLEGVLELQEMGFSRVVLSRELSLQEIEYICKNSKIEIEVFTHGALCISYSGQCLFSSIVGGRSGNRGKCAQPCRLPYELLMDDATANATTATPNGSNGFNGSTTALATNSGAVSSTIATQNLKPLDKGYLLSPRDLCGLEYLPQLMNAGVTCLKIEGRMKTPEYVATVTRIYRKYLDLALALTTDSNSSSKATDFSTYSDNTHFEIDELKLDNFKIDNQDKKDLLQVFNRGGFSNGHLESAPNRELVYKNKSNNMGIYLGTITNFNSNKGHITFSMPRNVQANDDNNASNASDITLAIGDKISVENRNHESSIYTISELMINDKNVPQASDGDKVKIGRMKGKIYAGDKIYKMADKQLSSAVLETLNKENRKIDLNCKLVIKKGVPVELTVFDGSDTSGPENNCTFQNVCHIPLCVKIVSNIVPVDAVNSPITRERLIAQLSKTNNTPFQFKNIEIDLDDGLYIQGISNINELRRQALAQYEEKLVDSFRRDLKISGDDSAQTFELAQAKAQAQTLAQAQAQTQAQPQAQAQTQAQPQAQALSQAQATAPKSKKVSLLLNSLNPNFDYTKLQNVDKIYIPLKYFILKDFSVIVKTITETFNTYIYMPTIIRENYNKLITKNLPKALETYNLKGFVISNIGNLELLKNYTNKYEFICNYTFNVFNNLTISELNNAAKYSVATQSPSQNCYSTVTLSPELNKSDLRMLLAELSNFDANTQSTQSSIQPSASTLTTELIVYGRTPLMNSNYCLLGKSNKCYTSCQHLCNSSNKFYLKDRLGFLFRVIPDNIDTVTTIYNSKITSIEHKDINVDSIRIDILDETIENINSIIAIVKTGAKLEGADFTNGNFSREI